jgi:hypothetical protein
MMSKDIIQLIIEDHNRGRAMYVQVQLVLEASLLHNSGYCSLCSMVPQHSCYSHGGIAWSNQPQHITVCFAQQFVVGTTCRIMLDMHQRFFPFTRRSPDVQIHMH